MNIQEPWHRHDEMWHKEVLDGMARMLDVLHDLSDHLQDIAGKLAQAQRPVPANSEPEAKQQVLLSIKTLAEYLGLTPEAVRHMEASGHAPVVTRVGSRIYVHRDDVHHWLSELRSHPQARQAQPLRTSFGPGRIGSPLRTTSGTEKKPYCTGSHTEPLSAGSYHGRGVCRICREDVLINNNGLLRMHYPRWH